ncbi:MAG: hypothetical protein J0H83_12840 [Candidatus Melainabacteria bacterium]|jgi:hypothetical protein|nr:hypothetical protein [Candidatus Melainabacteria bacterium]
MASKFENHSNQSDAHKAGEKSGFPVTYDIDGIHKPPLNKMEYDINKKAVCLDGPKLPDLKLNPSVDSNEHYQKIAKDAASFIAINGNFNIAMRHSLKDANENDKLTGNGKGHKTVDELLKYINKDLCGTYFSVIRQNDKITLLDSRDNQNIKHDAKGNAKLTPRFSWSLNKEPYAY